MVGNIVILSPVLPLTTRRIYLPCPPSPALLDCSCWACRLDGPYAPLPCTPPHARHSPGPLPHMRTTGDTCTRHALLHGPVLPGTTAARSLPGPDHPTAAQPRAPGLPHCLLPAATTTHHCLPGIVVIYYLRRANIACLLDVLLVHATVSRAWPARRTTYAAAPHFVTSTRTLPGWILWWAAFFLLTGC